MKTLGHGGVIPPAIVPDERALHHSELSTSLGVVVPLTPEALYLRIQQCIKEMPDLKAASVTPATAKWLGEASLLVEECGNLGDTSAFKAQISLIGGGFRSGTDLISIILHRSLARAANMAPAASHGKFIAAGKPFDAFASMAALLSEAKSDVLVVDPYADEKLLTRFLVSVPEGVSVRVLADGKKYKPTLKPAMESWNEQLGATRPIEIRKTIKAILHDRLILIDNKDVWVVGQSFNQLATNSNTYLQPADAELAAMKLEAFSQIWTEADSL